jgi:hypothetical protein
MNVEMTINRMLRLSIPGLIAACLSLSPILLAQQSTGSTGPTLIPYRKGSVWGFCDRNKKIIIEPRYGDAKCFSEGLAAVELGGKWCFIDKTGREAIPPRFDEARNFSEGLAAVKLNGKWGLIDRSGREVVAPKFDEYISSLSFSEGVARIKLDGKWGYIGRDGTEYFEP